MSDAKRDHSAFRRTAAASQAAPQRAPAGPTPQATQRQTLQLRTLQLEALDVAPPWGSTAACGGDPYNAVGNRVAPSSGRR